MFIPLLSDYPRRRSAFSPTSLSGLALWLKADAGLFQDAAGTTPAVLDADPVGLWRDQSGNGNHISQSTSTKRPTLKLAIQNGRSVIRFDGVDDFLASAGVVNNSQSYSLFAVFAFASTAGTVQTVAGNNNAISTGYTIELLTGSRSLRYLNVANPTDGAGTTAWELWSAVQSGSTPHLYVNGTVQSLTPSSATPLAPGAGAKFSLAARPDGAGVMPGDLGEVLLYGSALADSNRQAVEAYLRKRWGTP